MWYNVLHERAETNKAGRKQGEKIQRPRREEQKHSHTLLVLWQQWETLFLLEKLRDEPSAFFRIIFPFIQAETGMYINDSGTPALCEKLLFVFEAGDWFLLSPTESQKEHT